MTTFDQRDAAIRFEWGLEGIQALAPVSDVMVIVDVLSFTTCVDMAVGNGALVYPYQGPKEELAGFADSVDALYAAPGREHGTGYALSPASLTTIPAGTRLVLPSPNGSRLSLATGEVPTLAGCLRNANAVADRAQSLGTRISVIAAGERWRPAGTLRPSLEDLLGAGAIITALSGSRSPEAASAAHAFAAARPTLAEMLHGCGSGQELLTRGFAEDVELARQLNVSRAAPQLIDGAYRWIGSG